MSLFLNKFYVILLNYLNILYLLKLNILFLAFHVVNFSFILFRIEPHICNNVSNLERVLFNYHFLLKIVSQNAYRFLIKFGSLTLHLHPLDKIINHHLAIAFLIRQCSTFFINFSAWAFRKKIHLEKGYVIYSKIFLAFMAIYSYLLLDEICNLD